MTTLYWIQGGACGGDTMALLNTESPNLIEALTYLGIDLLWHPSLSVGAPRDHAEIYREIVAGTRTLDILCVEGSIIRGPGGTGMFDATGGVPKKDRIAALAARTRFVVAVGTCASFGGFGADAETETTGLQYHKKRPGGFLGEAFRSREGLPVINLPGCPCHGDVTAGTIAALASGETLDLTRYQSPREWYGLLVHQGCVRNEYHEYQVEEHDFGERGCMFFHMGCRAPLTYGPCNKILWNRRSSKTAAGVPCIGCTDPDFPPPDPFFRTRNIAGIPLDLPEGVDRAHYLAYKGMAAAAAPERLRHRKTWV